MKKQNDNKGVITFLVVIVVILSVLCVLFATDVISFKSNIENSDQEATENHETEVNNSNNTVVINKNSLDEKTVNKLLGIVGISTNEPNKGICLNMAVSDNNYKENSEEIFSWYVADNNLTTYHYDEDKCKGSVECQNAYSCGGCSSILKKDADEISKQYGFKDMNFSEMPEYNDEYRFVSSSCCGNHCPYYISHDITVEIVNDSTIRIVDSQVVSEYSEMSDNYGEILNSNTQTVTYEFKKDNNTYYLNNVNVVK